MADEETVVRAIRLVQQQLEVHNYLTKRLLFLLARESIPAEDIEAWETRIDTRLEQIVQGSEHDGS